VSIDLQYVDVLDDGKGESDEKKKDRSGEEAETRECGMASVAMSKIQIVVVILVKAFAAAPAERHGERRSVQLGGEEEERERRHQKKALPRKFVCCT
jgi:hypothetical protein